MLKLVLAATAASSLVASAAGAAPFMNGDFESPGGVAIRTQIGDGTPAPLADGGFLTGWSHAGGSYDVYEADDTGDGLSAQSGTHYVSFGHSGAAGGLLSQTFDTLVGASYTVNYYVAEQQGDDPAQILRAMVTNGTETLSEDNSGLTSSFLAGKGITFTAQDTTTTITFQDATDGANAGGSSNLALDSVSVSGGDGAAVPEAATWAMMILGMGMVGYAMRRHKRTAGVSFA